MNTEIFIEKSKNIHCTKKYNYSLVKYKNNKTKVKIICPLHGKFEQYPDNHLSGKGCSKCNKSRGELKIGMILKKNNIKHFIQYKFENCKYKKPLFFDFYLPDHNICIEYDGTQHFVKSFYDDEKENLQVRKLRDSIKTNYCINNNIRLLRIKYSENILERLQFLTN